MFSDSTRADTGARATGRRTMTNESLSRRLAWRLRRWTLPQGRSHRPNVRRPEIIVAGLFSTASGIGESARLCSSALDRLGLAHRKIDLSRLFGQVDLDEAGGLLTLPEGEGVVLLHLNAPETERALFEIGARRGSRWTFIGFWAWESSSLPASWTAAARYLDEIWTPSRFCAEVVRDRIKKKAVRICPHAVLPIPARPSAPEHAVAADPGIVCLAMADSRSSFHRKNLLGAIKIFQDAFSRESHHRLILKTRNLNEAPAWAQTLSEIVSIDPRIEIINEALSSSELRILIATCDVLLSPHRAEGFGLTLAEAMMLGKLVIATGWSGNLEFMNEQNSVLMPYRLVAVKDPAGVYSGENGAQWADPDLSAGANALRQLAGDVARRSEFGRRARNDAVLKLAPGNWRMALHEAGFNA